MRTLCISDIHIDINKDYPVIDLLAKHVRDSNCGAVLIAGDISEHADLSIRAVKELSSMSGAACYYVPGNHDMWAEAGQGEKIDNDRIYETYCSDENCLCGKIVTIGDHAVLGDIGWYDYSYGDRSFSFADFERMQHGGRTWQDHVRNSWTKNNTEKNEAFLEKIEAELERSKDRKQMVVTHMLPIRDFCVPSDQLEMWKYFNAFLGSEKYGALYRKYPVEYALCGHVHYRRDVEKDGIRYLCRCLNYSTEWHGNLNCLEQIIQASEIIDL